MNRKLLLLALLLCTASGAFASSLIQGNWRWRNNDGDENTATFKAAQNTSIVVSDYSVIRLRVRVENQSNASDQTHNVGALKYSTAAGGPFLNVGSVNSAFAYAAGTVAPSAKAPTTNSGFLTTINAAVLSPYTYMSGEYFTAERDLSNNADKAPISPSKYADLEFVIKPTGNILPSTTYYFLIENAKDGGAHNLASLTTSAVVLPVNFLSFEAKPNSNSVQLKWSTASEKNNNRFEVSRSVDAKNWQVIGSEKGRGNSDVVSSYDFADSKPLSGVSYYQLAQFDNDGTKTILSTKAVNVSLNATVDVQVYPNPTSKEINLLIANYNGKNVEARLFSQDGKLIHKEQFNNDIQDKKLNMSKMPSAGVYVLKVKGDGLSANKKVVIL